MKKWILLAVVVLMLGYALYDFVIASDDSASEGDDRAVIYPELDEPNQKVGTGIKQGQYAPDVQLETIDGETVRLSDYRGQPVILNFWATWCPPCRAEIPDFQKLYDDEDQNVEILAINMTNTEDSVEGVQDFVEEFEMTFPVLMDTEGEVANHFQINAYPTSYIIDSEGRTAYVVQGAMNHDFMMQALGKIE
ncbi:MULTISPECIES: peroxiredoxin family protein [Allobacillus]|uniref:TlpA family protein disulfide reductase n=1 Tax=Allobacillus halotolerans TaxID=570278 RepID=A0ABS6GQ55_9BACI|nr:MULTISPECIES: TlpA disulfide reductase family protein [Allobacillus]MBU6080769.1 TlpA family protein disulfide reductase [Allobacillus halotolerans]TSJ65782.1 TlpA family protein disulfide reductase [Allobacillus sp. SKP2-8]